MRSSVQKNQTVKKTTAILLSLSSLAIVSCSSIAMNSLNNVQPTAETQKTLTPDSVLSDLMAGNQNYVNSKSVKPNISQRRAMGKEGQYPKAYVLSCVDSRVPVEQVFNQGIGDIFVGRVAGNIETTEQLGSMEFAAAVGGVKVIMVLGHEACGAVKGACDHLKMGNLTPLLDQIQPAISKVKGHSGERNSKNDEFVAEVVEKNAELTVSDIRKRSKVLRDLEKEGKLKIVGGVYSLHTRAVTLLK
ncbi:carbonic anhydrase family protein [Akkermansiaceae bacterium]|nr:carbonic anhydrase family protein [Akkermansiaceae bacterium]